MWVRGSSGPEARAQRLRRLRRPAFFGTLRRTAPLSDVWGYDRGTPVDRYYIERFLEEHRGDIAGRVLEVADSRYTDRYGSDVEASEVLDIDAGNGRATIVGDLGRPETIPDASFDCFVLTQTLQYVFDLSQAVRAVHRCLVPGGVALVTVPAVTRIARSVGPDGDFWRFTGAAVRGLFVESFRQVDVRSYGNVLTATAFLQGLAREELTARELDGDDPYFPVVVTARAVK